MQRLEVSGAVRPLQGSLGVKGLISKTRLLLLLINSETNAWHNTLFHRSEHETNINYLEIRFPPHRKHCE